MTTMAERSDRLRSATTRALIDEAERADKSLALANNELNRAISRARIRVSNGFPPFGDDIDGTVRELTAAAAAISNIVAEIIGRK